MDIRQIKQDIILGFGSVALGFAGIMMTLHFADTTNPGIDGKFVPYFAASLAVIFGLAMVGVAFFQLKKAKALQVQETNTVREPLLSSRAVILWCMITVYFLGVTIVGYVVSSIAMILVTIPFFGYTKKSVICIIACLLPVCVWVLFTKFAGVPMPITLLF